GAGGHESFVSGAATAPEGQSFLCLRSTANVGGTRVSTIVAGFAEGTRVTTPRHHVQYVVTEHGAVDLSVLGDLERPRALIALAHPDFRDGLRASLRSEGAHADAAPRLPGLARRDVGGAARPAGGHAGRLRALRTLLHLLEE